MKNRMIAVIGSLVAGFVGFACATTYDQTSGTTSGYPASAGGKIFLLEKTVDFSKLTSGTNGCYYTFLNIPAGTLVLGVGYKIETGNTAACNVDIGDATYTAGYFSAADVRTQVTATAWSTFSFATNYVAASGGDTNGVAVRAQPATAAVLAGCGRFYSSAGVINVLLNATATQLKLTVRALCVPVGGL